MEQPNFVSGKVGEQKRSASKPRSFDREHAFCHPLGPLRPQEPRSLGAWVPGSGFPRFLSLSLPREAPRRGPFRVVPREHRPRPIARRSTARNPAASCARRDPELSACSQLVKLRNQNRISNVSTLARGPSPFSAGLSSFSAAGHVKQGGGSARAGRRVSRTEPTDWVHWQRGFSCEETVRPRTPPFLPAIPAGVRPSAQRR